MIIQMYNENCVDRKKVMKRRYTRHVSEATAIATEFGNSAKIIVPRSWLKRRVIAFLHSEYHEQNPGCPSREEAAHNPTG